MCQSSEWWAGRMSSKPQPGQGPFLRVPGFQLEGREAVVRPFKLCQYPRRRRDSATGLGDGEKYQGREDENKKKSPEAQGFCCTGEDMAACQWTWQTVQPSTS